MKKTLLLAFLFPVLLNGFAQSFKNIQWTDSFSPQNPGHLCGLYGEQAGKPFLVFTNTEKAFTQISLILCDTTTGKHLQWGHGFETPMNALVGAYVSGNTYVLIIENIYTNEENGNAVQEITSISFTGPGPGVEFKTLSKAETKNKAHFNKAKFAVSPDRRRSVLFLESPFKTGTNEEVKIFVFDENGKEESSTFSMEIESKQNVHNYPQLSNAGVVYFLKRDKDKTQQFRYYLYAFVPGTNSLARKAIALPNTSISDIRGTVTPQGEFIVGGFTSSENIHAYEGYFLMKFDQACNQKFKTQGPFDESTFLKFLSKKEYSKNPVISNYFIENITVGPTGKIYLAAEAYEEKEAFYNYKDVMLVCFTEAGDYKTTFRVNKEQGTQEAYTHWASYKTFYNNDTLMVMHNNLVRVEGAKGPEPLLQVTKVNEKFGTMPAKAAYPLDVPNDTPFFNPDIFIAKGGKYFMAVFSNLDRTSFRLVRVDL